MDDFDGTFLEAFEGFVSVGNFGGAALEAVSLGGGVYVVVTVSPARPGFHSPSTGGHYKGKDPTVAVSELEAKWVDGTRVQYIGKSDCLRRRVWELVGFAYGAPIAHWGGRYLWQLKGREVLQLAWKTTPGEDPEAVESAMIERFKGQFSGRLPFANLRE